MPAAPLILAGVVTALGAGVFAHAALSSGDDEAAAAPQTRSTPVVTPVATSEPIDLVTSVLGGANSITTKAAKLGAGAAGVQSERMPWDEPPAWDEASPWHVGGEPGGQWASPDLHVAAAELALRARRNGDVQRQRAFEDLQDDMAGVWARNHREMLERAASVAPINTPDPADLDVTAAWMGLNQ